MTDTTFATQSSKATSENVLRRAQDDALRQAHAEPRPERSRRSSQSAQDDALRGAQDDALRQAQDKAWRTLAEFTVFSEPGNERQAMEQVTEAVQELNLSEARLERLKTAVAEATMNAMEHGNKYQPELPVSIQVLASERALAVHVTDQGGGQPIPEAVTPDLEAKLAGLQSPRGWGLFLIKNMVDEMHVSSDETHHTVELVFHLEGEKDASDNS